MKKRAYVILGPESSGTRLLTKIMIAGGCHGDASHFQPFDKCSFGNLSPIVWRRSVPHSGKDINLQSMLDRLHDYEVMVVVIVRDWTVTEKSQVKNKHASSIEVANAKVKSALKSIFSQLILTNSDFVLVTYESLVLNPVKIQQSLFNRLGLKILSTIRITNENVKWL